MVSDKILLIVIEIKVAAVETQIYGTHTYRTRLIRKKKKIYIICTMYIGSVNLSNLNVKF